MRNNAMAEFLRGYIIDKKNVLNIQLSYRLKRCNVRQTIEQVPFPGFKHCKTSPSMLLSGTDYLRIM